MNIDVGKGCSISDTWIPVGVDTGVLDLNKKSIMTADKVQLNSCTSKFAIIGLNMNGKFVLYFGSEHGSVSWGLTPETIEKHKIRLAE